MLKLKLQSLGHLMWRTDSLEKTLMLGKIEDRRWRGQQRMKWLYGITNSMDMSLSKLLKEISPEYSLEDWCWSWSSNTLANWCKEVTHWKNPRCLEKLKAGGEGDHGGWDVWIASQMDKSFDQALQELDDGHGSHGLAKTWTWLRDWTN